LTSERKDQGFSNLKLKNSVGLAGQIGADYMLTDHVMLNASVWYVDINTKATTDLGASRVRVNVDVDPWVYMVGVGYKF
jgi:outer membrane protein